MSAARDIAAFLLIAGAFIGAQVVAVGVTRVLAEIIIAVLPDEPLVWPAVMVAAVAAALLFLMGAMPAGMQLLQRIR